jgi:hypothetical protein
VTGIWVKTRKEAKNLDDVFQSKQTKCYKNFLGIFTVWYDKLEGLTLENATTLAYLWLQN